MTGFIILLLRYDFKVLYTLSDFKFFWDLREELIKILNFEFLGKFVIITKI